MQIRKMEEKDVEQVALIEQETFSIPWSAGSFLETIKRSDTIYLVAEEEGEILGYCGLWQSFEEGEIPNVAVKKEARNRGIGRKLMENICSAGGEAGITAFTLEVRTGNEHALHLYKSLGFEAVGIRKGFYDKPKEDAVIMWKK